MQFLSKKWLDMNKEVAYMKVLCWTNKAFVTDLERCLANVKYKWLNKLKYV
jgi:hypothetical protein